MVNLGCGVLIFVALILIMTHVRRNELIGAGLLLLSIVILTLTNLHIF